MLHDTSAQIMPTNEALRSLEEYDQLKKFLVEKNVQFFSKKEQTVQDLIHHHIKQRDTNDPFYLVDLSIVLEQFKEWHDYLPRVEPHYAIKSNHDPMIIEALSALGCAFDCASKGEIELVLNLGVSPDKIIYANTVKDPQYIEFAKSQNVNLMTFDNEVELHKIKMYHPSANLICRIKTDDSHSALRFSKKFGCTLKNAKDFLKKAKELDLNVIGVSFHVGGKAHDPSPWTGAIKDAKEVFKIGQDLGFNMYYLDIGGGFPGSPQDAHCTFEDIAIDINKHLDEYFNDVPNLKIIGEPGRHFSSRSHTMAFRVIGKREVEDEDEGFHFEYYMNDGLYSSFNSVVFDEADPRFKPLHPTNGKKFKSTLFGPTCDSMDTITEKAHLQELNVGDWLYADYMGAYTIAAASKFNGFPRAGRYHIFRY